jgi:hypothetical protein
MKFTTRDEPGALVERDGLLDTVQSSALSIAEGVFDELRSHAAPALRGVDRDVPHPTVRGRVHEGEESNETVVLERAHTASQRVEPRKLRGLERPSFRLEERLGERELEDGEASHLHHGRSTPYSASAKGSSQA